MPEVRREFLSDQYFCVLSHSRLASVGEVPAAYVQHS